MNSSYQVALVAAAVFCLAVIGYFITTRSEADPDAITTGPPTEIVDVVPAKPIPTPAKPKPAAANTSTPAAPKPATPPTNPTTAPTVDPLPAVTLDDGSPPTFTLNTVDELTMPADLVGSEITEDPAATLDKPVATDAPTTTPDKPTLTADFRKYTVKPGDTFTSIATAQYGSDRYWYDIAQANPLADPVKLRPGDVINLPDLSALTARNNRKPEFSSGPVEYLVRPGDNLEIIAQRHYGDSSTWREIYRANRTRIGPNPDRIQVGMKLVIPPAPRKAR